jgi:hypothetical protein
MAEGEVAGEARGPSVERAGGGEGGLQIKDQCQTPRNTDQVRSEFLVHIKMPHQDTQQGTGGATSLDSAQLQPRRTVHVD